MLKVVDVAGRKREEKRIPGSHRRGEGMRERSHLKLLDSLSSPCENDAGF